MSAVLFQMAQNDVKNITNPARITGIGGDNATEFYLFLRDMPPGSQWVFPFTYGFMFVLDTPWIGRGVRVDASMTPPGAQAPPVTSKIAQLAAYDTDVQFNPGVTAGTSILQRWQINSAPAAGSQASASRAAAIGVTHVADSAVLSCNNSNTATAVSANWDIDNGGSNLSQGNHSVPAVAGTGFVTSMGPLLNLRGSPNVGMRIQYAAGVVNMTQIVSLSGFDQ